MTKKELEKENKELKDKLSSFEEKFTEFQGILKEVNLYNEKLVCAYKVSMSGGLSQEEKIEMSEAFDEVSDSEGVKKLYKSFLISKKR